MDGMTTFGNNDSVFSHGEESIAMLDELLKSLENCKYHSTLIRDVKPDSVRFVFQHFRESIEAYRDLCDELEDDKDEIRHEYEEKVIQFFNRFMNADLTDESNYRAGELARLVHQLDNRVGELDHEIRELQEQVEYWEDLAKQKSEGLKRMLNEKYGTDILHMYPKITLNNPQNFCGNCKHFVTHPCDIATCNNKHADPFIVDPDDASCSHFESNQVDRDKPDQPCCKACNRDDCDDCTLCPF